MTSLRQIMLDTKAHKLKINDEKINETVEWVFSVLKQQACDQHTDTTITIEGDTLAYSTRNSATKTKLDKVVISGELWQEYFDVIVARLRQKDSGMRLKTNGFDIQVEWGDTNTCQIQ